MSRSTRASCSTRTCCANCRSASRGACSSDASVSKSFAWRDCLTWAIAEPQVLAEYTRDTGATIMPAPTSPIERMVDDATGAQRKSVEDFMAWFNVNIWGDDPFQATFEGRDR